MGPKPGALERGAIASNAALGALCRQLAETGTPALTTALEVLPAATSATGALAYRLEGRELVLAGEVGLPRRAKPWLARLPLEDDPWFVAQRVAKAGTSEVAREPAGTRDGHSARAHLLEAGWSTVAAWPIGTSRSIRAVLVLAGSSLGAFGPQTRSMMETASAALAVALARQDELDRRRDEMLSEARTTELATVGWLASTAAADLAAPLGRMDLQLGDERSTLAVLRHTLDRLRDENDALGRRLDEPARLIDELIELSWDLRSTLREARAMARQLRSYSEDSKLEAIDLGELVVETVGLLRDGLARRGIDLRSTPSASSLRIIGRRDAIAVLVGQLLQQASGACQQGRRKPALVQITTHAEPTGHVLTVEWSGTPARVAQRQHLDPFFDPRAASTLGEVGLALARRTVLAHNGHIEVGASPLGGGLVRVVFPGPSAVSRRERDHAHRPTPVPPSTEPGTVPVLLWVDEDPAIARTLARSLPGYRVQAAASLEEARRLLASLPAPPALVLCDLGLDDGGAIELHREADAALASRFVFTTGGVISQEVARYVVGSGRPTLIKPVALEEVTALLALPSDELAQSPSVAPTLSHGSSRPPDEPLPGARTDPDRR